MTAVLLFLLALPSVAGTSKAPKIRLPDATGREWRLSDHAASPAVVFVAFTAGCPIQRKLMPTLRRLEADYARRKVALVFIDPSPQDDAASIKEEAAAFGVTAPILIDKDQRVSASLGFTRSAEAAVVRPADRRVLYRGAVDDQFHYDGQKPAARRRYLADALEDTLAGREPALARTESFGCYINYLRPSVRPR